LNEAGLPSRILAKSNRDGYLNPETHIGHQPVRVLKWNIVDQFEKTHPEFKAEYQELLKRHGLKPVIAYNYTEGPIFNPTNPEEALIPCVKNKQIEIPETFISYVWIVCYTLIVCFEEEVNKPLLNRLFGHKENIDSQSLAQARLLYEYGMSLRKSYSPWDKERLPNPEEYEDSEKYYIERANNLCKLAMGCILCHELAHIELGHQDEKDRYVPQYERIDWEWDADNYAVSAMSKGMSDENVKINYGMGMVLGFSAVLLLQANLQNKDHPDSHHRLESILKSLNADSRSSFWGVAIVTLILWAKKYKKQLNQPKTVEDFKEWFYYLFNQLR
jgi:hypothetical protein